MEKDPALCGDAMVKVRQHDVRVPPFNEIVGPKLPLGIAPEEPQIQPLARPPVVIVRKERRVLAEIRQENHVRCH